MAVKKPREGQVIGSQQKFLEGAGAGGGAFRIKKLFGPMKKAHTNKAGVRFHMNRMLTNSGATPEEVSRITKKILDQ
jgi:hypothetical protein